MMKASSAHHFLLRRKLTREISRVRCLVPQQHHIIGQVRPTVQVAEAGLGRGQMLLFSNLLPMP